MHTPRRAAAALLTLLAVLAGCGGAADHGSRHTGRMKTETQRGTVLALADTGAPAAADFGRADTDFGLAVLRELQSKNATGNVVFSPTSLANGLGMAYLGARGQTATAMAAGLRLPATGQPLVAGLRDRTKALRALNADKVQVAVSDNVWADRGLPTEQAFLDALTTGYDAGLRRLDILSDPEGARAAVNDTIKQDTRGHIPDLLPAGALNGMGWVLTDAVYLKADWARPFEARATRDATFHTAAGGTVRTKFMNGSGTYGYAQAAGWTAVALPYAGGRLTMLALLPDRDGTVLDRAALDQVTGALTPASMALALPKVDLRWRGELTPVLTALGMGPAFGAGADFTGVSNDAGKIGFVMHAATMAVDEKGTEASAATAVGLRATAIARAPELKVTFDRPYLLVVRDTTTGEPLFIARVTDPRRTG
ncbi:MAG: serpin family protein [Mycobacteriales bacterium]